MNDFEKMNNSFKEQSNALDEEQKLLTKKLFAMDDLSVALEYLNQVLKLFDEFSTSDEDVVNLIKKLYNIPLEISSLVMIPVDDIEEMKNKILGFVKSNIPGGIKGMLSVQRMVAVKDLNREFSDIVSENEIFKKVSDLVYYLQIIQIWFVCKYVISFDTNNKVGENIKDFAKELANIHGYESFDDMTDDDKYMALTLWRDHIKTSTSNIDE
jgi:hypothetical protein